MNEALDVDPTRVPIGLDVPIGDARVAGENRAFFRARRIFALNLISSPGSGKTTLLEATIRALAEEGPIGVIEGDQATDADARRVRRAGARAVQVNTGRGCHLEASMVKGALAELALPDGALLFIENVGNLVCPAAFDLGESAKVVLGAFTEGEDKPLKYPHVFRASRLAILNKMDLQPHLDFEPARFVERALEVNPGLQVLTLSAKTGAGLDGWLDWVRARRARDGSAMDDHGMGQNLARAASHTDREGTGPR